MKTKISLVIPLLPVLVLASPSPYAPSGYSIGGGQNMAIYYSESGQRLLKEGDKGQTIHWG